MEEITLRGRLTMKRCVLIMEEEGTEGIVVDVCPGG